MPQPGEPTLTDRVYQGLPAAGAVAGGAVGALRPGLIDAGASLGWLPDVMRQGVRALKPEAQEKVVTASVRGRELVQYMWDELEKIASSGHGYRVVLRPTPWELGINDTRNKDPQRGLAYASDVGTAAAVGAGAAAAPAAVLGGPILGRTLTERGRSAAIDDAARDVSTLGQAYLKTKHEMAGKTLSELVTGMMNGRSQDAGESLRRIADTAKGQIASPEIKELVGRRLKGTAKGMATAASAAALLKGLHNVAQYEYARAATGKEKRASAESDPIAEVLGTEVETLDEKRARGYPILQAPPGYVFNPELSAFVPDMQQPGWMTEEQAGQAQNNQQFYQQGQQDQAVGAAQQEIDQGVQEQAEALATQHAQAQQGQMMQEVELQKQMSKIQQPSAVTGAPAPQAPKPTHPAAKKPGQTITVKVGK